MADKIFRPLIHRSNMPAGEDARVSDGLHWRLVSRPHIWMPPTDVFETEDAIVIRVEIAGMKEDDFEISLEGRILMVRGIRQDVVERRAYHRMEIPFGEFIIEVELPAPIAADEVEAIYRDGFLRITFPKAKPFQIHIGG